MSENLATNHLIRKYVGIVNRQSWVNIHSHFTWTLFHFHRCPCCCCFFFLSCCTSDTQMWHLYIWIVKRKNQCLNNIDIGQRRKYRCRTTKYTEQSKYAYNHTNEQNHSKVTRPHRINESETIHTHTQSVCVRCACV